MPGFLLHLACAKKVCELSPSLVAPENYKLFLIGNLIPDLANSKRESHFQIESPDGWYVPDLIQAEQTLGSFLEDPVVLGAFCHLAYDRLFFTNYLGAKYYLEDGIVHEKTNQHSWPLEVFLSKDVLYGTYSLFNLYLIKDKLVPNYELWSLPNPPLTGIPVFDDRNNKDIKAELRMLFSDPVSDIPYPIFNYQDVVTSISEGAELFVNLASHYGLG